MSMNDTLSDMLTRIRNAHSVKNDVTYCLFSKLNLNVLKVLKEEGYIRDFISEEIEGEKSKIKIELKYSEGQPVIKKIKRISKPGIRVYSKIKEMPRSYGGLGISIISTPKGVMSDSTARNQNVGGEILCQVF
ncbi:MAG: 30S ribosomal protein S8 [Alphaproteobacteria bacterium MarineAlpha5_Bin12]|nr:30S ribosomal protein S8 [Pelagibacteraceae bacterium]MBG76297.1 30S ribosomal protein S8 [Pelagibacteraceae bacterium]PPR42099.1 MAG: 30S ribosomal protein S8 [Alphaproteobacteria bacterium MarineAlpha5_Bin12]